MVVNKSHLHTELECFENVI